MPLRRPIVKTSSPINSIPVEFSYFVDKLTLEHDPSKLWYQGKDMDCWFFKGTRGRHPRIYLHHEALYGFKPQTNMRRFIANIFYELEEREKEIDKRIFVLVRDRCDVGCVNPRHFTFADHPRLRSDE